MPEETQSGRVYRLPTEAEWEYSCRGGATLSKPFHLGDSLSSRQANFDGNYPYGDAPKGKNLERTSKVGSYSTNAFGLFDMHGNVVEWCQDGYAPFDLSIVKDPTGPATSPENRRVIRGRYVAGFRGDCIGFRAVCVKRT